MWTSRLPESRRLTLAGLLCGIVLLVGIPSAKAEDFNLCGDWQGCWQDTRSGHHGPLRATFQCCDEMHYRVTFSGRFMAVIPFRYSVTLNVVGREGDKILLVL